MTEDSAKPDDTILEMIRKLEYHEIAMPVVIGIVAGRSQRLSPGAFARLLSCLLRFRISWATAW
jgi:hypothetical protein